MRTAIYVISLDTSLERRETFKRHASIAPPEVEWSFFDAHRGLSEGLIYREQDALIARGKLMHSGELGVYSSHYGVWQKMLQEGAEQALVLEDDVIIDWQFVAALAQVDLSKLGINYLKLFNKNMTPYKVLTNRFYRRWLIDCRGFAYGAQAYLLTRQGAEAFSRVCKSVRRPIDDEMDRSWDHGIPNLAIFPFPAFERYVQSTIGPSRFEVPHIPFLISVRRNAFRISEKLRRARQALTGYGHRNSVTDAGVQ